LTKKGRGVQCGVFQGKELSFILCPFFPIKRWACRACGAQSEDFDGEKEEGKLRNMGYEKGRGKVNKIGPAPNVR
jgi:hypothetical protein